MGEEAGDYWTVEVTLGAPASEEGEAVREAVTNFLWEAGALGVVDEARGNGPGDPAVLQAFFPPGADAESLATRIRAYAAELRTLGVGPTGPVAVGRLPPAPWAEAWRAHFRPLAVGRRLCVSPPWERPESALAAGREVVWIEPGRAFGTGGHATTRGCLELLERVIERGRVTRVLDIGTGSGILAIAALRLGVPEALGIDPDPDATSAAMENAVRNGVTARLRVETTDLASWSGRPVDLVLANLLAAAHVTHAADLARAVEPGGWAVLGGLLVHEVPVVTGALAPYGLWLEEVAELEGWAALSCGRFR
jgi:ribosomal protein L11 methyltransferase